MNLKFYIHGLALSLCILLPNLVYARPALILSPEQSEYNLVSHISYLEDRTGELTLTAVSSKNHANEWQDHKKNRLSLGYSKSAYWLRLDLLSEADIVTPWLLEIAYPLLDQIDVYLIAENRQPQHFHSGDDLPFSQRPIFHRNFLFPLLLPYKQKAQLYIRVASTSALLLPIKLWKEYSHTSHDQKNVLLESLFFGVLFIIGLYGLTVFGVMANRAYFYFTLVVFNGLLMFMQQLGYSYCYLFPQAIWWQDNGVLISAWSNQIFFALFTIDFLSLKKEARYWRIFILCCAAIYMIFLLALAFAPKVILVPITQYSNVCMWLIWLLAGIQRWRQGDKAARFYTISLLCVALGIATSMMSILGFIPYNDLSRNSGQVALLVMFLVLAYGLAVEMLDERKAKVRALRQRAEAEHALVNAQQEIIKAFESNLKLKNDFLIAINHELRTPMNAILGGLQIMQSKPLEHLKSPLDIVQSGAADMMHLVNDILTQSEIQSGNISVKTDHFALKPLLASLHECYQIRCDEKGLKLEWQISESVPQWLYSDEGKLTAILAKLLDNAVKFTDRGLVRFTLDCDQECSPWALQATVQDSGIGIAEAEQAHIFEAFTQTESGFQRRFGGLGIGLSICRKFIKALGGELTLQSRLGEGSCFSVTLPVAAGKTVAVGIKKLAPAELYILVVEDNRVNQKVMTKMLEKLGYRCLIAKHGVEALEIIDREIFSLILMDLQMPVMDGFHCTEKIRQRDDEKKNIPIIAVTANLLAADKEHCIQSGMNDFLKKPVKLEFLQDSLARYIEVAKPV
ncbi:MAG: response regulator [Pseudomonadales bacterium]|nr:response regulator [Pseudomonadales bacterium]